MPGFQYGKLSAAWESKLAWLPSFLFSVKMIVFVLSGISKQFCHQNNLHVLHLKHSSARMTRLVFRTTVQLNVVRCDEVEMEETGERMWSPIENLLDQAPPPYSDKYLQLDFYQRGQSHRCYQAEVRSPVSTIAKPLHFLLPPSNGLVFKGVKVTSSGWEVGLVKQWTTR